MKKNKALFLDIMLNNSDAYSYDATNDSFEKKWWYRTPIEAYKMLSCKLHLHWDANPLVFVYDFKLVK